MATRLVLSLAVFFALTACSPPDLERRTLEYFETHNRHDVTAKVAFLTEDIIFAMPGTESLSGTFQLRDIFAWDSVLSSELIASDLEVRGDTVFVNSLVERNDWFRLSGIGEVRFLPGTKMIFRDDLIRTIETATIVPEDEQAVTDSVNAMMEWLRWSHPELAPDVQDGTLFRYNAKNAEIWIELLTEWRDSKSEPGSEAL